MPKTNKIAKEKASEIEKYRNETKDKATDKRLRAVQLRIEGYDNKAIGLIVEAHPTVVSRWIGAYVKNGPAALKKGKYGGNRRNMSFEEERKFLESFKEKAANGQYVTVEEIKMAYCEKIGHQCGKGQIYRVLKRHEWRKIVPRKEHPNKASEAQIEASKKLTSESTN